ncbi:MAG: hypothetical protein QY326_01530 [Bdellovibrionota bacterium]|nr:MAG: hypothetical protein QY326_01530 [Bdellovibrionota bacterium]
MSTKRTLAAAALVVSLAATAVIAEQRCVYLDSRGQTKVVRSINQVPAQSRGRARCGEIMQNMHLAAPQEVELGATVRRDSIATSLGRVELRWPRKIETLFGRTPQRAVAESMQAASRALKGRGFPIELQRLDVQWQMVFLDEDLPETQIPAYLVSNCHPAWMTPPTNLYVVAQRVVAGCGGSSKGKASVNDGELASVLLHEIGHAVEYQMLQGKGDADRMRAEGFASWFEQYSGDFSPLIAEDAAKRRYFAMAKASIGRSSFFEFDGSGAAYARASLIFHALVDRKGFEGLRAAYSHMANSGAGLLQALEALYDWNQQKIESESLRILERSP